jgi:prepilin signal peptidase PulO-like enzyme (type II secretory pathway)
MTEIIGTLLFSLALILTGDQLLNLARLWLQSTEVATPAVIRGWGPLLLFWLLISHALIIAGWLHILPPREVFRGLFLGGWFLMLMALDLTGYWMPLSFTAPTGVSGLLYSLWILPERTPPVLLAEAAGTFCCLYLLRTLSGRRQESLGMGDVCLISALVLWFPLFQVICVLIPATLFTLLTGVLLRRRRLPFGLFLCPAASLLPFLPVLTQALI